MTSERHAGFTACDESEEPTGETGRVSRTTCSDGSAASLHSWRPSAQLEAVERYGRFEILGRVGRGGMAEILLARERSMAGSTRHLVIKRVLPEVADDDEMLHMFLDEARVVMGLSHPNLCQIYDVGEHAGSWFIAMEWVNGATLHQLIRRALSSASIDYSVMARIIAQCAEALHHAHTARDNEGRPLNLVHRDVSPHNIMVAYDGRVKLLDFGIAKSTASTHHTEAGVVKGKICYMAPEQWLSAPLDGRTDVFALGACLHEALTGQMAFKRDSQMEVMRAALARDVPKLRELVPGMPEALEQIVCRALAVKPEDRFESAREMSEALERYIADTAEPVTTSRLSSYTRALFRDEVELGPVLERPMTRARLGTASPPLLLPPVPPELLGGPRPSPVLPLPVPPPFRSLPPSAAEARAASYDSRPFAAMDPPRVPYDSADDDEDEAFREAPTRNDGRTLRAREPAFGMTERAAFATEAPRMPATMSEAPTDPRQSTEAPAGDAMLRPLARTLPMPIAESVRRIARVVLPAAAAVLLVSYAALTYGGGAQTHVATAPHTPSLTASSTPPALGAQAPREDASPQLASTAAPAQAPIAPAPRLSPSNAVVVNDGRLSINTKPWSTVYLGKKLLGTTPLDDVPVPSGALQLKLVDRDGHVHLRNVPRTSDKKRTVFFEFTP